MHIIVLAALFFLVALAYASVGFGGGSSYNALLVISGADFRSIPAIALSCNILVVSGGIYHFRKSGHLFISDLLPFVALSVPFAWYGGRMVVEEPVFVALLGISLLATGLQLLWSSWKELQPRHDQRFNAWLIGLPLGAAAGLLAGIVGIGGGIFLAPCLYLAGWSEPRRIAAMASGFILVNSVAGLAGQLMKQGMYSPLTDWLAAWPLFAAVLAGGQIGSRLVSRGLPEKWIQRLTGLLITYVAVRLLLRWFTAY